jgi:uncharacterized protein
MMSSVAPTAAPSVPAEADLTTPSASIAATTARERVAGIDVLRGFALLGILVLNINDFSGPEATHDTPFFEAFSGAHGSLNLLTFYIKWLFFEAKMRGLFSMLFGAGVILLTSRAERRGTAENVADIYLRRNMLLVLFGILHYLLIWHGDILFDYGLAALLVLFPLRKLRPGTLFLAGTFLSLVVATWGGIVYVGTVKNVSLMHQAAAIAANEKAGHPPTASDKEITKKWQETVEKHHATPEKIQKEIKEAKEGYLAGVAARVQEFGDSFYRDHIILMADNVSAMMIGMGLMRMGFLTGELPYLLYILTAVIGFAISLPVYAIGLAKAVASKLDFIAIGEWMFAPYYLTRESGMLAIAAVLVMLVKSGSLRPVQRGLAAVGQTALTNYLMTSLLCQFIFVWGPWKLYGQLEYYQLNYVVAGIWALNLIFSVLWLRAFAFGPAEWVWRSLTYLEPQPMRLRAARA